MMDLRFNGTYNWVKGLAKIEFIDADAIAATVRGQLLKCQDLVALTDTYPVRIRIMADASYQNQAALAIDSRPRDVPLHRLPALDQ